MGQGAQEGPTAALGTKGIDMGFLIRSAFWLSLVLLVIPIGSNDAEGDSAIGPIEAFFAAQAVVGDVAGLCDRNPQACEVGKSALHTIGVRARESARIAYDMLDEEGGAQPVHTGSIDQGTEETAEIDAAAAPLGSAVPIPSPRDAALAN